MAKQEIEGQLTELEGTMFKRQVFQVVAHAPEDLRWFRYWDLEQVLRPPQTSAPLHVWLSQLTLVTFIFET